MFAAFMKKYVKLRDLCASVVKKYLLINRRNPPCIGHKNDFQKSLRIVSSCQKLSVEVLGYGSSPPAPWSATLYAPSHHRQQISSGFGQKKSR
jgi:hypothetical protein